MSCSASVPTMADTLEQPLPVSGLLALAMTGFIAILSETLPAGLLGQISAGMHISEAMSGQLVTVYALGSLLTAIPLVTLTQGWRRRPVLLLAIVGFLLFNTLTAVSQSYPLTLLARFLTGVAAGLAWGVIAGHARRMVSPTQQGRAMAVAMIGAPVALSLGVPAGTWLGELIGWRATFALVSASTVGLIVWVLCKVPDFEGHKPGQRPGVAQVLRTPGVLTVLLVILTWVLAHNVLYTYIVPFLAAADMAASTGLVLLTFGIAALAGIALVGMWIERHLRSMVVLSLIGFAAVALVLGCSRQSPMLVFFSVALWGLTYGGAPTLLQTASADAAGEGADVAQSMIVTVWNLAIAAGGVLGGVLLTQWGVGSFTWVLLALIGAALLIAGRARRHGFKPGVRVAG
ncbi:MFS transporter [Pseudomonas sp. UM16]|uniref:MFS transporter n=1 Tax=Pseudomonas sp. UM16 TaxID=3158962 RepID=UPI00398FADEF